MKKIYKKYIGERATPYIYRRTTGYIYFMNIPCERGERFESSIENI